MITTHVLDTTRGRPADGVHVSLFVSEGRNEWRELGRGVTDADGRLRTLTEGKTLGTGLHRLSFETGEWFRSRGIDCFHPVVEIIFDVSNANEHVHVPLLLSPFGYTTYRGS